MRQRRSEGARRGRRAPHSPSARSGQSCGSGEAILAVTGKSPPPAHRLRAAWGWDFTVSLDKGYAAGPEWPEPSPRGAPAQDPGYRLGRVRAPRTVPRKRHAPHRPRKRMSLVGPAPRGGAGRGEPSPDTAWRSRRGQDGLAGVPVRAGVRRGLPGGERGRGPVRDGARVCLAAPVVYATFGSAECHPKDDMHRLHRSG